MKQPTSSAGHVQDQVIIPVSALAEASSGQPNLPQTELFHEGRREEYIEYGIPLYKASIKGDWKIAQVILQKKPELVRWSITENCETALHVAVTPAKETKQMQHFMKNLVRMMELKDLELQNNNFNTALCLAAAAGNVEMCKILVENNPALMLIPGSKQMIPLYKAALFGHSDVVNYLYGKSKGLCDHGETNKNHGWLLLKCVEADLFDIALQILEDRPELDSYYGSVLGVLAKKPHAFAGKSSKIGKSAKKKRLQDVSGVALQMRLELLWFKEVESMIPPYYRVQKNKDDLTPYELFIKEHKDLVAQGEKWMKGTSSQCMVVAALIATIVFAAALTVPGGYIQDNGKKDNGKKDNGIPVFHSKVTFMVFVVTDGISLFSSSASILMFLSIITSRYGERDFLQSLHKKLMLGLATLFLSITTMTIAFSVSFFVLYKSCLVWMPIVISMFAVLPVFLFARLQYPLLVDMRNSLKPSKYFEDHKLKQFLKGLFHSIKLFRKGLVSKFKR